MTDEESILDNDDLTYCLNQIAKGFSIRGTNRPGKVSQTDEAKDRLILAEGYSLLCKIYAPMNVEELMKRFKFGWGRCSKCNRLVAARKNGTAWRHGWKKKSALSNCLGSGQPLKNWRERHLWENKGML